MNDRDAGRFPIGSSIDLKALATDPFPIYASLREHEPVSYVRALNMYLVTRHADVCKILQDDRHFVVGTENSVILDIFGEHMMTVENPEHDRLRSPHQRFFVPPAVRRDLEPAIRAHADRLIDGFAGESGADLRRRFAARLPILTMLSLFGLDLDEEQVLRDWYDKFELALSNFTWDASIRADGQASSAAFREMIQRYVDRLRAKPEATPAGSLLAALVNDQDEQLDDEEIRHNALIIFFGGISTVEALILNTLYALCTQPEMLERVRTDLSLLPKAVNETIRWQGPVQSATRHVVRDIEFLGHRFRAGDTINCMLGAANRDPAIFDSPDEFDIDRPNAARHVGFAVGPHHCLGSHLARAEARIALEQLFSRLDGLCLDHERIESPTGYEFRRPESAIAAWKPSGAR